MEATPTITSRLPYRHCAKCFNRIVLHDSPKAIVSNAAKSLSVPTHLQTHFALSVPSN